MAIYSVNQVRHLYVANELATAKVTPTSSAGTIRPVADTKKNHLYFEYKGATDLMRSDLIPIDNIMYAKVTKADDLKKKATETTVVLDPDINNGNPIAGQDYFLNINIRQYIGMSDRNQTVKYGSVKAFKGMTASKFYVQMAKSLALNFSKEVEPLLKFYVTTYSAATEVTASTDITRLTDNYIGIKITEAEQEWILGVKAQEPVYYNAFATSINVDGEELVWGKVTQTSVDGAHNGKDIADLEYFCMGDRGDVYRNIGWPQVMNTKYLVDASRAYDVLDIHYYYVGNNENPQKSEKDITIVAPQGGRMNDLVKAVNAATGLSIEEPYPSSGA